MREPEHRTPSSPPGSPTAERSAAARGDGRPKRVGVSVIIPTYNEADNISTVLDRVGRALIDHDHELIVVDDDSPDQTWRLALGEAAANPRIRVLRRIDRRGLSSAVLEGMDAARGDVIAVLDADLQHDEAALPRLVEAIESGEADVAIGSRNAEGGSYGDFGTGRRILSFGGAQAARRLLGLAVTDPMSGYFAVSRARVDEIRPRLNPRGFKILLDVLAVGSRPRVAEVGYGFRSRRHGETKLSGSVVAAYFVAIAELSLGRLRAPTFIAYVAVAMTALSLRLSLASMLEVIGAGTALGLVALEVGVIAEFLGHRHYTFAPGGAPALPRLTRLTRFHFVALNGLLAEAGLSRLVDWWLVADPSRGYGLVPVFVTSTLGVMAIMGAAYHLNRAITWPESRTGPPGPPAQTSRPTTESTRAEISSTARR